MNSDTEFVSVIIPVYNDEERLATVLDCLERQSYPRDRYEVIVVDNASDRSPEATVSRFPQARLVSESRRGSYAARNRGLEVARGPLLAFTDADCIVPPDWLEAGVAALRDLDRHGLIAGDIRLRFKRPGRPNAAEIYDIVHGFNPERSASNGFAYTGNAFTHRSVFDAVGEFNAELLSRGDLEWGKRVAAAGMPVVYSAEAWIEHPARHRLSEILTKERRLMAGKVRMIADDAWDRDPPEYSRFPWWTKIVPPLGQVLELSRDPRLSGAWQRLRFVAIAFLTHYVRGLERIRLKIGGSAERR